MSPSTTRPTTVTAAFWILLIGLLLDLISAIVLIASGAALSGGSVAVEGNTLSGPIVITTGVVAIVFVVIELFVLGKMRSGKNWARIVITVLEVLSILGLAAGFSILGAIGAVISVVVIVLLWLPASNEYFRAAK